MNIIETVKSILLDFPKISNVCNDIHVDFTDDTPTNYGLSSTGDMVLMEDVCGNQLRQHSFILYAVYQSQSDYDRLANSGVLLELSYWLEKQASNQEIEVVIDDSTTLTGVLKKLTCANGMLYAIPNETMNDAVQYQLQIIAQYKIESEDI